MISTKWTWTSFYYFFHIIFRSSWSPWHSLTSKTTLFRKNIFKHRKKSYQSSNILIFAIFVAYYNRWHKSINWSAIEILIKINLKKPWPIFWKVFFLRGVVEFHELYDDLPMVKIIWKNYPLVAIVYRISYILKNDFTISRITRSIFSRKYSPY